MEAINEDIVLYMKKERKKLNPFHYKHFFYTSIINKLSNNSPLTEYEEGLLAKAIKEKEAKENEFMEKI